MPAASLLSGGYASVGSLYHPARALTSSARVEESVWGQSGERTSREGDPRPESHTRDPVQSE